MTHFRHTFMGNAGFEDMKRYARQGTDFGREIVNVLNERAQLEQYYAKALRRLGQRITAAAANVIGSPLSQAWKTVGVETEKESEAHRDFGLNLIEECVKPLSTITEGQLKPRRRMEQNVETTGKLWNDRNAEHTKIKRRLHTCTRENETLIDQINGPRPKTERDQQKLLMKQQKSEDSMQRADLDYYNSLIQLEKSRQDWEVASYDCCDAVEDMEDSRLRNLCHTIQKYTDLLYEIPSKLKTTCKVIDEVTEKLSPQKEILVVSDKMKGVPYTSEQLLCDYYEENFSCQMSIDRRKRSVDKLLERFIHQCQKERTHRDGMRRLELASQNGDVQQQGDIANRLLQTNAMLTLLDVVRYKLNCTLASLDGSTLPHHPLANNIENHTDRQGIMHSILRLRPGEADERMKEDNNSDRPSRGRSSKPKSSTKSRAPKHRSSSVEAKHNGTGNHHHRNKHFDTVSVATDLRSDRRRSDVSSRTAVVPPTPMTPVTPTTPLFPAPPPPIKPTPSTSSKVPSSVGSDGSSIVCKCIALYDYKPVREDEISIHEGDIISVFEKGEDDWWRGEVGQKIGLFPANYVDIEINV